MKIKLVFLLLKKINIIKLQNLILYNEEEITNEYIKIRVSIKYDVKYIKKFISIFLEDENSEIKNIELDKIIKINKKEFFKE